MAQSTSRSIGQIWWGRERRESYRDGESRKKFNVRAVPEPWYERRARSAVDSSLPGIDCAEDFFAVAGPPSLSCLQRLERTFQIYINMAQKLQSRYSTAVQGIDTTGQPRQGLQHIYQLGTLLTLRTAVAEHVATISYAWMFRRTIWVGATESLGFGIGMQPKHRLLEANPERTLSKVRRGQQSCTTRRATTTKTCISTHRPIMYPALVQLPLTVSAHARVRSSHVTPRRARPQYRRQGDGTFNYSKRQRRRLLKDARYLQLLNSTKFWSSFSWLNHYVLAFPCIKVRNS